MVGPSPGKSDAAFVAPFLEVLVDELAAAVAVDAADGNGEGVINVAGGFPRPPLGLVLERPDLRPAQGHFCHGDGSGVIRADFASPVMGNRVYLAKTGLFLVPRLVKDFCLLGFLCLSVPPGIFRPDFVFLCHGKTHPFPPESVVSGSMLIFPWLDFYVRFLAPHG